MKLAILSLALLILGCGNKPKPQLSIFTTAVPFTCPVGAFFTYTRTGEWTCLQYGAPARVTPAQWEAAQGLYNPKPIVLGPEWGIESWPIKTPPYHESVAYYTRKGEIVVCGTVHIKDKPVFADSGDVKHGEMFNDVPSAMKAVEEWCDDSSKINGK